MSGPTTEDRLVQATTAAYFHDVLGWDSIYAYNDEALGRTAPWAASTKARWCWHATCALPW
jgi:hypothetical protein